MISKKHQCIYIHIHKTAGTSIEKKLGHFNTLKRGVQDHRTIKDIELLTNRNVHFRKMLYTIKKGKFNKTNHYLKLTLSPELSQKQYRDYYKFSFVRNTWSRIYSWYANVMRDELHREDYGIGNTDYSLYDFICKKLNPTTFSQLYFLTNSNGVVAMDFIGRFENLNQDFKIVCERIGIADSTLPKMLKTNNSHYTQFYDVKTKELVANLYKEEIEYFNFKFGD